MRSGIGVVALLAGVAWGATTGGQEPAPGTEEGTPELRSYWTAQPVATTILAEPLVLFRDNHSTSQPVVLNDLTGDTVLGTRDLRFGAELGPRLSLRVPIDDWSWEVSYFGLQEWHSQAIAIDDNNLSLPGYLGVQTPSDYNQADTMTVDYSSKLNNVEINAYRTFGAVSFLGGFRYLNLAEVFRIEAIDSDTGTSDYYIHTRNNLYGGQVGVEWRYMRDRLGVVFGGKAGLFGNSAGQHTYLRDLDNTVVLRDEWVQRSRFSFVGDLSLAASYRLTQVLALRASYNLFWLKNVALAPDQLNFDDPLVTPASLSTSGSQLLHGLGLGLEARW